MRINCAQRKNPNPARLVRLLCKNGDCSKGGLSLAEMTTDHPGWEVLRNLQRGRFHRGLLQVRVFRDELTPIVSRSGHCRTDELTPLALQTN